MPNTRTQTTSRNLLLQTYICAVELVSWGVGPDVTLLVATKWVYVTPLVVDYGFKQSNVIMT